MSSGIVTPDIPSLRDEARGRENHLDVKPFVETLRVTNPVRQRRASSRTTVPDTFSDLGCKARLYSKISGPDWSSERPISLSEWSFRVSLSFGSLRACIGSFCRLPRPGARAWTHPPMRVSIASPREWPRIASKIGLGIAGLLHLGFGTDNRRCRVDAPQVTALADLSWTKSAACVQQN